MRHYASRSRVADRVRSAQPGAFAGPDELDEGAAVAAGLDHRLDAASRSVHREQLSHQTCYLGAYVAEVVRHLTFRTAAGELDRRQLLRRGTTRAGMAGWHGHLAPPHCRGLRRGTAVGRLHAHGAARVRPTPRSLRRRRQGTGSSSTRTTLPAPCRHTRAFLISVCPGFSGGRIGTARSAKGARLMVGRVASIRRVRMPAPYVGRTCCMHGNRLQLGA